MKLYRRVIFISTLLDEVLKTREELLKENKLLKQEIKQLKEEATNKAKRQEESDRIDEQYRNFGAWK